MVSRCKIGTGRLVSIVSYSHSSLMILAFAFQFHIYSGDNVRLFSHSRGLLHADYESSDGPSFQVLQNIYPWVRGRAGINVVTVTIKCRDQCLNIFSGCGVTRAVGFTIYWLHAPMIINLNNKLIKTDSLSSWLFVHITDWRFRKQEIPRIAKPKL